MVATSNAEEDDGLPKACYKCHKKKPILARGWREGPRLSGEMWWTCPDCFAQEIRETLEAARWMQEHAKPLPSRKEIEDREHERFRLETAKLISIVEHAARVRGLPALRARPDDYGSGCKITAEYENPDYSSTTRRFSDREIAFMKQAIHQEPGYDVHGLIEHELWIPWPRYPIAINNIRLYTKRRRIVLGYCQSCGQSYNLAEEKCPKCGAPTATSGVRLFQE
jgi:hypothetical protein